MGESATRYIESSTQDGVLVITIRATAMRDTQICYAIRDQMIEAIDPDETQNVIINLESLTFVGSIGLLGFLAVRRKIPKSRIVICNVTDTIREVFLLCRMISADNSADSPFEMTATLQDASNKLHV
ncbi:MAG: STAS domain-containing protein [Planctomycetaceae bacterium]|nr:STAS domain-containing protein [Planctomycetaceae bacterium]